MFWIIKFFVSLQPQNGNDLLLGYGVMVTLQILVLSFLVRIQVAQPSKKSCEYNKFAAFLFLSPKYKNSPNLQEAEAINLSSKKFFYSHSMVALGFGDIS